MQGDLGDRTRLQHILDAIVEIESYTRQVGFDDFVVNSMMRFASIKQLEIIGEAANSLTDEFKRRFSDIEWRAIIGLRNILVHHYFGIDENVVWGIIQKDIPELKARVVEILKSLENRVV